MFEKIFGKKGAPRKGDKNSINPFDGKFLSCAAQPCPPPPLFVGRDGLDSIPLEGCSLSSATVFGSEGSTLRDRGRRSVEPRVSHSFGASGHGEGGVLDDARRAFVRDTHDRNSARRSLVSRFDEDDIVCGSGDGPDHCDPAAQNVGAGPSEHSGGSLGQFGSQSTGSAKYSRLFLTTTCKERLRLLQSAMKEMSDKSGVMSDVVDRMLHWSLPAIRLEFGDGVASRIERTIPAHSRADVFRLGAGGDDSTADAEDDGEREGEGSGGGNGGSFCGSDDSLPHSGHGSQRGRRSRGRPPSRGRSRSHFEHVRPLCWDDSKDGALQSGPCNNRSAHMLESMGQWEGSKTPDVVFVEPVKLLQLLGLFDLSCPRHGAGCAVDVSSVGYPGQICRISLACKKSCRWTWHSALVVGVVYSCRPQQQLFHATVSAGMTYTVVLNDFCIALGVAPVHKPTFYSCMRGEPNVREGWNAKVVRQGVRYCDLAIDTIMRSGRPVTLMVDGRYDSARSAQHCTVTAIECDTRLVVGVHTLWPKQEGKASNQLEVPAVVRLLRGLLSRGFKIQCVVSDDCAALGPQLERLGIEWQKDCHHKLKKICKALRKVVTLKVPKKLNNPHQCVSESQFMQFTKKKLLDALTDRYGPGCLTAKEEQLKKSDFVAVVMSKMYPYDTIKNNKTLVVDADGVSEFHMHEVGHWFLRASQLCRDEGGDFVTLHNDVMMITDHWAGDHSRCVADRELLCLKAGGSSRLPLYTHDDPVYDIIRQTLGRHCSTTVYSYYTEFRHTSMVETFQGTIIIYAKKALHFEKSREPRLAIAVIRWNSHAWQDPLEYRVRRPSGTSIRPRSSHYRHNWLPADSLMDRLSTFIFGSKCVSDWARCLLEYDDCDVSGEVGSSTPPLPRDLFCRGEDTIARDEDDVASGADPDVVRDDDVFIIGDEDGLPAQADAVSDRSCNSLSDAHETFMYLEDGDGAMVRQDSEDLAEMLKVRLKGGAIDKDIIEVNDDTNFEEVGKDMVHGGLKCGGALVGPIGHHEELVVPEARMKCGLVGVLADADLMKVIAKVNFVWRKSQPMQVTLADGHTHKSIDRCINSVPVYFAPHASKAVSFDVLDTKFDMILGMSWLQSEDHPVNFYCHAVHIRDGNGILVPCMGPPPHPSITVRWCPPRAFELPSHGTTLRRWACVFSTPSLPMTSHRRTPRRTHASPSFSTPMVTFSESRTESYRIDQSATRSFSRPGLYLRINRENCEFGRTRILYLGHEIFAEGLKLDDTRVTNIRDGRRPQSVTEVEVYEASRTSDVEPPELIEGELVEFTIPARGNYYTDGQFGWRSVVLSADAWLWTYREARPGQERGLVRAYLYLGLDAAKDTALSLVTSGTSYAISRALRCLRDEVPAFRADDAQNPLTLFHRRPPLDIAGELVIARDRYFSYGSSCLRAIVPAFVVDSIFGGIGGVVMAYLAFRELEVFGRGYHDLDYLYYSLATGGLRGGDERVQLIELIRSIGDEWPQPLCVWDWLDRELRAGPEYVTCIGSLFSDDWGGWWSEDVGRPLIYSHQLARYYQAIGQAPYRVEDEFDDEWWEREDDEDAWESDWDDSDSEEELDDTDAHFPRIGVATSTYRTSPDKALRELKERIRPLRCAQPDDGEPEVMGGPILAELERPLERPSERPLGRPSERPLERSLERERAQTAAWIEVRTEPPSYWRDSRDSRRSPTYDRSDKGDRRRDEWREPQGREPAWRDRDRPHERGTSPRRVFDPQTGKQKVILRELPHDELEFTAVLKLAMKAEADDYKDLVWKGLKQRDVPLFRDYETDRCPDFHDQPWADRRFQFDEDRPSRSRDLESMMAEMRTMGITGVDNSSSTHGALGTTGILMVSRALGTLRTGMEEMEEILADIGNLIGIAETDIVKDMIGRTEQETDVPTPEETGSMILEEIGEMIPVGDMTEEDILRCQGIPGLQDHPTHMPEHREDRRLEDCPDLKRAIDEEIVVLDNRKYVKWADDLGDVSMFPSMKENVDARRVRPSKGKEVARSRSIRILMSSDEDVPTTPIRVAATKSARPSSSKKTDTDYVMAKKDGQRIDGQEVILSPRKRGARKFTMKSSLDDIDTVELSSVTAKADRAATMFLDGKEGVPPDKFYILGSGTVDVILNDEETLEGVIDNGSEVVIIDKGLAVRLGLDLDRSYHFDIETAAGKKQKVTGVCHKAAIEVDGLRVQMPVFAVKGCSSELLSGRTWLSHVHAVTIERPDESQMPSIKRPDSGRIMIEMVEPRDPRNRAALAAKGEPDRIALGSRSFKFREKKYGLLLTEEEGRVVEIEDLGSRILVNGNSYPKDEDEEFGGMISMDIGDGNLTEQEKERVVEVLKTCDTAIAFSDAERVRIDPRFAQPARIYTVLHTPWNDVGWKFARKEEEVIAFLKEKMASHVAEPSDSAYANRWFFIQKPNGKIQWIQDLQKVNAVTIRDVGSIPHADLLAEVAAGRSIYLVCDPFSSYDEIPLDPRDRHLKTMHTPVGLVRMMVVPMGWTNGVAVFQRAMLVVLKDFIPDKVEVFLDNFPIKGPVLRDETEVAPGVRRFVEQHLTDICAILEQLDEANLTVGGTKSRWAVSSIKILGFICDSKGRCANPAKLDKFLNWPTPLHSVTEVRQFLGVMGYWRVFIRAYAEKAEPLQTLLRKTDKFYWNSSQELAVLTLKEEFKEDGRILGVPFFDDETNRPFIVSTDAGSCSVGGLLSQKDADGKERPLRFESRTLNTAEHNYNQLKKEVLAVLRCLDTFRHYIYGRRFILRVDPTAVASVLQKDFTLTDPTIARWLIRIRLYDYTVERISGAKNAVADGLSRIPIEVERPIVVTALTITEPRRTDQFLVNLYAGKHCAIGLHQSGEESSDSEIRRQEAQYCLRAGHLFRRPIGSGMPLRVVRDPEERQEIIAELHDGVVGGHRGVKGTYEKVRRLYWWEGQYTNVEKYCVTCEGCQKRSLVRYKEPLHPSYPTRPGEKVHIDLVKMPRGVGNMNYRFVLRSGTTTAVYFRLGTGDLFRVLCVTCSNRKRTLVDAVVLVSCNQLRIYGRNMGNLHLMYENGQSDFEIAGQIDEVYKWHEVEHVACCVRDAIGAAGGGTGAAGTRSLRLLGHDGAKWIMRKKKVKNVKPGVAYIHNDKLGRKEVVYNVPVDPPTKKGKKEKQEGEWFVQVPEPDAHCWKTMESLTDNEKCRMLKKVLDCEVVWVQAGSPALTKLRKLSVQQVVNLVNCNRVLVHLLNYYQFKHDKRSHVDWSSRFPFLKSRSAIFRQFESRGLDAELWDGSTKYVTDSSLFKDCPPYMGCDDDRSIEATEKLAGHKKLSVNWRNKVLSVLTGSRLESREIALAEGIVHIKWNDTGDVTSIASFGNDPLEADIRNVEVKEAVVATKSHTFVLDLCEPTWCPLHWTLVVFVPRQQNLSFLASMNHLSFVKLLEGKWVRRSQQKKSFPLGNNLYTEDDRMYILFKGDDLRANTSVVYEGKLPAGAAAAVRVQRKVTQTDVSDIPFNPCDWSHTSPACRGSVYGDMERNPAQFVQLLESVTKKEEGVVFLGKPHAPSVWEVLKAGRHVIAMEGNSELLQFTIDLVKSEVNSGAHNCEFMVITETRARAWNNKTDMWFKLSARKRNKIYDFLFLQTRPKRDTHVEYVRRKDHMFTLLDNYHNASRMNVKTFLERLQSLYFVESEEEQTFGSYSSLISTEDEETTGIEFDATADEEGSDTESFDLQYDQHSAQHAILGRSVDKPSVPRVTDGETGAWHYPDEVAAKNASSGLRPSLTVSRSDIPPDHLSWTNANIHFLPEPQSRSTEVDWGHDMIWHPGVIQLAIQKGEWIVAVAVPDGGWMPLPHGSKSDFLDIARIAVLQKVRAENDSFAPEDVSIISTVGRLFAELQDKCWLELTEDYYDLDTSPSKGRVDWKIPPPSGTHVSTGSQGPDGGENEGDDAGGGKRVPGRQHEGDEAEGGSQGDTTTAEGSGGVAGEALGRQRSTGPGPEGSAQSAYVPSSSACSVMAALVALRAGSVETFKSAGIRTSMLVERTKWTDEQSWSGPGVASRHPKIDSGAVRDGTSTPAGDRQPLRSEREGACGGPGDREIAKETAKFAGIRTSSGKACGGPDDREMAKFAGIRTSSGKGGQPGILVQAGGAACGGREAHSSEIDTGSGEVAALHAGEEGRVMDKGKEVEEGDTGEELEEGGDKGEEEENEGEEGEETELAGLLGGQEGEKGKLDIGDGERTFGDDDDRSGESSDGFRQLYGEHREEDDDDDDTALGMETQVITTLSAERDDYEVEAMTSGVDLQHRFNEARVAVSLTKPSVRIDIEEVIDGILGDHHMSAQPSSTPGVDDPLDVKPSGGSVVDFSPTNSPMLPPTIASGGEGGIGGRQDVTSPKKTAAGTRALDVLALPAPTSPIKERREKPAGKQ
ncbi:hypothetical protein CBR_g25887 [Chara braunii]|uniref:RNA-directed DNA polymerase n=1 Tax=Chara braunii TaxID=69332 RepID=A0A388L6N5_CHABU|nr:hypothetical protein CBR_g25887 [Chara braunii]|eukprot:GBG77957.1 hypothetical protein CBR_g25887 [Chara braunii]